MVPTWMEAVLAVELAIVLYIFYQFPIIIINFLILPIAASIIVAYGIALKRSVIIQRFNFFAKEADTLALLIGFVIQIITFDYILIHYSNLGEFWGMTLLVMFGFLLTSVYLIKIYLYQEPPFLSVLFISYGIFIVLTIGSYYFFSIISPEVFLPI